MGYLPYQEVAINHSRENLGLHTDNVFVDAESFTSTFDGEVRVFSSLKEAIEMVRLSFMALSCRILQLTLIGSVEHWGHRSSGPSWSVFCGTDQSSM